MMECWLALAWLLENGLLTLDGFETRLDEAFAEVPEDDFLLSLEWARGDQSEIISLIREQADGTRPDPNRLKCFLARELAELSAHWSLADFARKAYDLWLQLPPDLAMTSPLAALASVDDPFAWEDEAAVRSILESIFEYARQSEHCFADKGGGNNG